MVNRYEYRLHQIEILIHAYTLEDKTIYSDEIKKLEDERNNILNDMNFKE